MITSTLIGFGPIRMIAYNNKTKTLFRGKKPDFIPRGKIVSKKEMRHYQYVRDYVNPIEKALEFKRMMEEENLNQNQLARKLKISRVRVCQLLSLLKLPEEQQKYILEYGKTEMITERQLRKTSVDFFFHSASQ